MSTALPKKVFIVGAGPSGLVALKEMLEAGHDVVCVDAKKQIGGLFSVSYEELYTTTTNMFLAFSDFPPEKGLKYWSKDEYLKYLEDYVDHFGLRGYIKLNTAVKRCALDKHTGHWKILTNASTPGETRRGSITLSGPVTKVVNHRKRAVLVFKQDTVAGYTYDADYLIVASGTNQVPNYPDLPNCNAKVVHSADFANAEICTGKKVLVIGNGESASDVAAQSTDVAEKVTLFSRRDFSLGPRFISKLLSDGAYNERQILTEQDDENSSSPNDMLEGITNSRVLSKLPIAFFSIVLDAMLSDVTKWHGEDSAAGILAKIDKKNFRKDFYALDTSAPTKSGGVLAHAVACKGLDIIISPKVDFIEDGNIARFENVSFMGKDETEVDVVDIEVDIIIACTGFSLNFDWIDMEGCDPIKANPRTWFKHCFPPGLGDKIAFLGYARPAQGGIPQCSELLARYVALLLRGERILPDDYAEQAIKEGKLETETFYSTPNATSLVEFPPYASSLARLIDCEPSVSLMSPSRFAKFWTLPQWMCFYRLNGPGANPDACWKVVDMYPIFDSMIPMPVLIVFFLYGALMQPLMILDYLASFLIDCNPPSSQALPRFYRWRFGGHFFQLSGNMMRLKDLVAPSFGFLLVDIALVGAAYLLLSTKPGTVALLIGVAGLVYVSVGKLVQLVTGSDTKTPESDRLVLSGTSQNEYGSIV